MILLGHSPMDALGLSLLTAEARSLALLLVLKDGRPTKRADLMLPAKAARVKHREGDGEGDVPDPFGFEGYEDRRLATWLGARAKKTRREEHQRLPIYAGPALLKPENAAVLKPAPKCV